MVKKKTKTPNWDRITLYIIMVILSVSIIYILDWWNYWLEFLGILFIGYIFGIIDTKILEREK